MSIKLPVPMLALPPAAGKPAGFVIAVLIGLALYAATRKPDQAPQKK